MPSNKRKSRRNKAASRNKTQAPRAPKTVPCPRCNEEIIVPKTCKHGKKLINCQGTGCTTAHFDEHSANCHPAAPSRPAHVPQRTAAGLREPPLTPAMSDPSTFTTETSAYGLLVTGLPNENLADLIKMFSSTHAVAMGHLSEQLTTLKARRGKLPRYIQGVPLDEWVHGLEEGSVLQVNEWTEKLRDLVEGRKTAEEIGYDDDDSDDEGDGCQTPSEEE